MLPRALALFWGEVVSWAAPWGLYALAASAVVLAAGWSRRREIMQRQGGPAIRSGMSLAPASLGSEMVDVLAEAASVMQRFESLAAEHFVALEVAVQPGLTVGANLRALQEILTELVRQAIEHSPCGRVLLGAAQVGGRVQIAVCDDAGNTDRALRASQLRQAQRWAALQGAILDIDVRPGQGTTTTLRLPAGPRTHGMDHHDPADVWSTAQPAREETGAGR